MPVVTFTTGTSTTTLGKDRDGDVGARGVVGVFSFFVFLRIFGGFFFGVAGASMAYFGTFNLLHIWKY